MIPLRPDKDRRQKSVLAFAAELESQLTTAVSSKETAVLSREIEKQISSFPSSFKDSDNLRHNEFDRLGTSIWNICTRLRRQHEVDKSQDTPFVLLVARVFSFLLLDCANQIGKSEASNVLRLMKIGIKAGKSCLEHKQNPLAMKVLEKVATYEASIKKTKCDMGQDGTKESERLIAEYYVLRTALAWYQDQLDVAEHMFKKSLASEQYFDSRTAECLADVLFEMGKDLFGKKQYTMSVKWLERAYEVLHGQELDKLSMDASELRISIIQMTVKALLALDTPETTEKSKGLIELLESEVGDKLVVLLLKLEMLTGLTNESFDSKAYYNVLQRMIRTLSLVESNFRLIMFHIRKLNDKSPSLAAKSLEEFLNSRLLDQVKEEWIEKAVITYLWIIVSQRENSDVLQPLNISSLLSELAHPLRPAAAHAAHMVLWKKIESSYTQGHYDVAEKWCHLALHHAFGRSGELNMARLSRKLLLCALSRNDMGGAKEIINAMPESARNEPMTRFLIYKLAIRCEDIGLAAECLSKVSAASTNDPTLLYACCLDAQQAGNKEQMLAALQVVLESSGHKSAAELHLPSLVRLIIGLMGSIIDEYTKNGKASELESTVERMCTTFEKAAAAVQKSRKNGNVIDGAWNIDELDWFSKNSYNMAIKNISTWSPRQSLRMLTSCIIFMDCYPTDIGEQMSEDLALRKMFCEFSAATALVSLAREEDNIEIQLQDYLLLRKHVDCFDNLLQAKLDKMGQDADQDLRRKFSILAAFDFEAACRLKAWESLSEVIYKAEVCKSSQVYEVMADCILCSQAPTNVLVTTLKLIVNELSNLESLDIQRFAKYMRCLFHIAISDHDELAEQLLSQVGQHAEQLKESDYPYPPEELEWIASKAFNQGIDFYCRNDDDSCQKWVAHALKLAHHCNDDGNLEAELQRRLANIRLGS